MHRGSVPVARVPSPTHIERGQESWDSFARSKLPGRGGLWLQWKDPGREAIEFDRARPSRSRWTDESACVIVLGHPPDRPHLAPWGFSVGRRWGPTLHSYPFSTSKSSIRLTFHCAGSGRDRLHLLHSMKAAQLVAISLRI